MYLKTNDTNCPYITAGKLYEVCESARNSKTLKHVIDDEGEVITAPLNRHSAHYGITWEIVEE